MEGTNVFNGGLVDPTLPELFNFINSEEDIENWILNENLIASERSCPACSKPMVKDKRAEGLDGWRWRCSDRSSCHKTLSCRSKSFFQILT